MTNSDLSAAAFSEFASKHTFDEIFDGRATPPAPVVPGTREALLDKVCKDLACTRTYTMKEWAVIETALSAPVPPADGALSDAERREIDENIRGELISDGKHVVASGTGAAEPVARDKNMFSQLADEPLAVIPESYSAPLHIRTAAEIEFARKAAKGALPPVRGDREASVPPVVRIECVKMVDCFEVEADPLWRVEVGGKCADFETEAGANSFRAAILSLPVQSSANEISRLNSQLANCHKEIFKLRDALLAAGGTP